MFYSLVTCDLYALYRVEKKERARLKTVKFNSKSREKGVSAPQRTHIDMEIKHNTLEVKSSIHNQFNLG